MFSPGLVVTLLAAFVVVPARAADLAPLGAPHSDSDASRGAWWLRLRGGYARSGEPRERMFGVLELGVALDRLVGGPPALAAPSSPTAPSAAPSSPASSAPQPGPLRAWSSASPRSSLTLTLTPALARATLAAAARVADGATPPRQLDSMASRTRSAAVLPELRLAAGSSRDQSQKLSPTLADPARFTRDGGRDLWFEARLTWRLERGLFSQDEIAIERLKAQSIEERQKRSRQVLDALLDWQRARLALGSELLSEEERAAAVLRELEALLRLDAWTDGWFSRRLELERPPDHSDAPLSFQDRDACDLPRGGLQGPHGFGDSPGTRGPQAARRCAKGASLTSLNSSGS